MNLRTPTLGLASGVTTFLLIGALTILAIGGRFGDSPGVGILAVFAGVVAGFAAFGLVVGFAGRLRGLPTVALVGYAAFGVAFLAIAGLQYVNVPGADAVFTFPVHLGTSLALALLAAAVAFRRGNRPAGGKPAI